MDKFVIKRNGTYLPFEAFKIEEAITKAFTSVNESLNVIVKIFKIKLKKRFTNMDIMK